MSRRNCWTLTALVLTFVTVPLQTAQAAAETEIIVRGGDMKRETLIPWDKLRVLPLRPGELFFTTAASHPQTREQFYFLDIISRIPNGGDATKVETWRYYPGSDLIASGAETSPFVQPHPEIRRLLDEAIAAGRVTRSWNIIVFAGILALIVAVGLTFASAKGRRR